MIFMTSNIGMHGSQNTVGFLERQGTPQERRNVRTAQAMQKLRDVLPLEFLNRIDEIFLFEKLNQDSLMKITERQIQLLSERSRQIGISLEYDSQAVAMIAGCPETERYGARPIRRFLTQEIESPLSRMWLHGQIHDGDTVRITTNPASHELALERKTAERVC